MGGGAGIRIDAIEDVRSIDRVVRAVHRHKGRVEAEVTLAPLE